MIVTIGDSVMNYMVPQSIAEKVAKLCGTSFCARRGRPRATDKALGEYACGDVDVEVLRQEITSRLERTECRPADMALLEKELIEEGKLKSTIPYKLLKKEFGDLISFSCQALNRHERALMLRRGVV